MADNLIPRKVADGSKPPKPRKKEINPLTPDQAMTFLQAARGDRFYALYVLATVGSLGPLGNVANHEPDNSAYLREEGQGGQDGQADNERRCIHGLLGGVGCYLCDPKHPYRLKQAGAV